jgi:hypothetical protein
VYSRQRRRNAQFQEQADTPSQDGSSPVWVFVAGLTKQVEHLLPYPAIPKRRFKQLPEDFVPRRSSRLAKKGAGTSSASVRQVQENLIRKLGLVADREVLGQETLEEHGRLFSRPLSQSHFTALLTLFGWKNPELIDAPREEMVLLSPTPAVL